MKKVVILDLEELKEEYGLREKELSEKVYEVISESDDYYILRNNFGKIKEYDKEFFSRYLDDEEIEISEYEDLKEYHKAINGEGFILLIDDEDDRRVSSIEITDEEGFVICSLGEPKYLIELEKILIIIKQFGFNFKNKEQGE